MSLPVQNPLTFRHPSARTLPLRRAYAAGSRMTISVEKVSGATKLPGVEAHTSNPNTQETEAGSSLCVQGQPVWSIQQVPDQPQTLSEALSGKKQKQNQQLNKQKKKEHSR